VTTTTKSGRPAVTRGVISDLTEEESYLYAIMQDHSGLDLMEFSTFDASSDDGCWRAWPFQWAWWRSRNPLQIDQCLAAGTLVLTQRGQVAIEEVQVGDRVLTHRNRWRPVTCVWDRGYQDTVVIRGHGHWGLQATADHRFFLEDGWAAPQRGDRWASPYLFPRSIVPAMPERGYKPGSPSNVPHDVDSVEFMWLYGLYVAEGSCSSSFGKGGTVNRVTLSVHEDEVDEVVDRIEKLGMRCRANRVGTEACFNIVISSRQLAEWMAPNGGRGSRSMHLMPWVFGLDEDLRRAVLDGASYGDAHTRKTGRVEYTTTSHRLAVDIKLLAQSLGLSAGITRHPGRTSKIGGRRVVGGGHFVVSWDHREGHSDLRSQVRGDHFRAMVTAVDPGDPARCYDLEVAEDHSFIADGIVVSNCARSVGKSLSILARMFVFPFRRPGQEAVITAPELIHLEPIINLIEGKFYSTRLGREMLQVGRSAVTHRPFMMNFRNGARLMGRIPQKDGKGVKGIHPLQLELDEAQDYPRRGWTELNETLKRGFDGAEWRAHGVTRGVRDKFYEYTQDKPSNPWRVHRYAAMWRPTWSDAEREEAITKYGGHRDDPDYRRNVLGLHGDPTAALFIVTRLYTCVDDDESSDYNQHEYVHLDISDSMIEELGPGGDPTDLLLFPDKHRGYDVVWCGMDVGLTHDPSEILVFGEYQPDAEERKAMAARKKACPKVGISRFKLLSRISLKRVTNPDQLRIILGVIAFYRAKVFALDKTGIGLPLYQDLLAAIRGDGNQEEITQVQARAAADVIKGYNFSAKVIVDIDDTIEVDETDDVVKEAGIHKNVLEQSTDVLREYVDTERLWLPWDDTLIAEFEGQTYSFSKSAIDQFGRPRRVFSEGRFHALDAARMFAMGHSQQTIEAIVNAKQENEAVITRFYQPGQ
jgi:hypothetical protein